MRGRPGPGPVIGLAVWAVLVALVTWLPAGVMGGYYETADPLIYMGVPMMIVSVAVGALIGVPNPHVPGNGPAGQARRSCERAERSLRSWP